MTTTMKKRMFALAAMMMLLVAMAIPAFAAGNPALSAGRYKFYPNESTYYHLNVYGNGNTGDDVTLYRPTGGNDQVWRLIGTSSYTYYVVSALSANQALNVYHATSNCQLHNYIGNTTDGNSDSAVHIWPDSRTIRLRDWSGLYLCFDDVKNNSNVYWSAQQSAWTWERVAN